MVTRSGVKVGGQGQGIGHEVKSGRGLGWVPGQGSRSGEGSRFGGQGWGQGRDVQVLGSRSGS